MEQPAVLLLLRAAFFGMQPLAEENYTASYNFEGSGLGSE